LFGDAQHHRFEGNRHGWPKTVHVLRDRGHHRLAHRLHLVGDVGVAALELPAFEEGQVREDVVGIHRGAADQDVVGDEQRQLLGVARISMLVCPAGSA
jgi:hypothetical protein